jgi:hypothetical protein
MIRKTRRMGVAAAVAMLLGAGAAYAQTVFDGNVLFQNAPNQIRTGEAPVGACATTSLDIATVRYTNNQYGINDAVGTNPLLASPYYTGNGLDDPKGVLSWVPAATSPALGPVGFKVVTLPSDGFFTQTCYSGAVPPSPEDDWTTGNWTFFNRNGTGRTDINYALPIQTLVGTYPNGYSCGTDSLYFLDRFVRIPNGATITIAAGAVFLGASDPLNYGALIIERGGRIECSGTRDNPVIFTSDVLPGTQGKGQWGGVWLLGRAVANCAGGDDCTFFGASCASEGGAIGLFGGNDDADNQGFIRYARVEFSGRPISLDNELNCWTFDGVGTGTVIEHIQAHEGDDDGIEFFGGVAQVKWAIASFMNDDYFDWQMGYRGKGQFIVTVTDNHVSASDNGIEADNNEFVFDADCANVGGGFHGRSNPIVANATIVGDPRPGLPGGAGGEGIQLRRGTQGTILNSIIMGFKDRGYDLDDDATFNAACAGGFPATTIHPCTGVSVTPRGDAAGLSVNFAPNPFRDRTVIEYSLPQQGRVTLRIYNVAGQVVRTLVDGEVPAGDHRVDFAAKSLPSGVYYASLRTGQGQISRNVMLIQ